MKALLYVRISILTAFAASLVIGDPVLLTIAPRTDATSVIFTALGTSG